MNLKNNENNIKVLYQTSTVHIKLLLENILDFSVVDNELTQIMNASNE